MDFKNITLTTQIPAWPGILAYNNQVIQSYLDVFYSETEGIIIAPVNTPGNVKAASGQFVNIVVDNLTVKNQFTNLYDNNTTADYNFYKLYIEPAVETTIGTGDPSVWPFRVAGWNYVDANQPYYKIKNLPDPIVFVNDNLSQVIGIFLDTSLYNDSNQFQVVLDPHFPYSIFTADPSDAGDPSAGTGFYVEFIATAYDPSYGTTWSQYKQGLNGAGGSGGGGYDPSNAVVNGTTNYIPKFSLPNTVIDSSLRVSGSTLYTYDINVDGIITLTDKKITGLATPTNLTDAVNLSYVNQFVSNSSVNNTFAQFVRSASTGSGLTWTAGVLNVDVSLVGISFNDMQAYVDPSLAKRDSSITNLYAIKANITSLGVYATNSSVNTALGSYATNASIGLAGFAKNASLGLYATNASINAAGFINNISLELLKFNYIDPSLVARDASITWLYDNTVNTAALLPYATNASVGLALGAYSTNASIGLAGFTTDVSVGLAIQDFTTNSSVNTALEVLSLYILSASTGYGLEWDASGFLDVSIAGITDAASISYVDGSLATILTYLNTYFPQYNYVENNFVANASFQEVINTYDFATNASVNYALLSYLTIASAATTYVTESSVNNAFNNTQLQINSLDNRVTILEASTGHVDFGYVDGSLAARDASITVLFNQLNTTDSSLSLLTISVTNDISILDSSLYALTVTSLEFATNASINAAGFAKNSSLNYLYAGQLSQDASIILIRGDNITQQNQISVLQGRATAIETSVAYLNLYSIKDASLSNDFIWVGGLLEVSIGSVYDAVTYEYVDGSLLTRDIEIGDLQQYSATYAYVDGSLGLRDTSIAYLNTQIQQINASLNDIIDISTLLVDFATNASVNTALTQFIRSTSTGVGLYWNAGLLDVSVSGGAGVTSLSALTDVSISSIADQNLLQYDVASSKWLNVAPLDASTYFQTKVVYNSVPGSGSSGTAGDVVYDASYLYVCTSTDTWGRVLLDYGF